MPVLCEFDTQSETTLSFPRPFVACPRLPHGIRRLHIDKEKAIVTSEIPFFTKTWANCRFTAWKPSALYRGVDHVFALAPCDLDFLTGEHLRNIWEDPQSPASVRIDFERPFVTPPKVVVFFNRIEFRNEHNWRVVTTTSNIDVNGFTLNIETWSDTVLYAAQTCWIAYPEDREHIFSTSVSTMDIRPWKLPQLEHSKEISFNSVEFLKKPSVFIALNYLDIDCKANLRINAYVDGISTTGLVWHIDSWDDTVLYGAGATIIAFN
ncbi:hypothetical protein BJY52DRAFT_1125550 [Lactarius psammicola]|nr:hypothetical protein BJY52DRAFT_134551 [Lactarius psammicola]KAI9450990.1 hypothetical protein BJY52DRAFT_1125550 [Lactarius psammicola]